MKSLAEEIFADKNLIVLEREIKTIKNLIKMIEAIAENNAIKNDLDFDVLNVAVFQRILIEKKNELILNKVDSYKQSLLETEGTDEFTTEHKITSVPSKDARDVQSPQANDTGGEKSVHNAGIRDNSRKQRQTSKK